VKNLVTFLLASILCYTSSLFSILWILVAVGIYASKQNFASSTQFITNCTQFPVAPAGTLVSCLEQSDGTYSCYLGSRDIWIIDLFLRSIGWWFIGVPLSVKEPILPGDIQYFFTSYGIRRFNKILKTISLINFLVVVFYAISMGIIQYRGLNTTGLETVCYTDSSLLSSKTGYIQEWWNHEVTNGSIVEIVRKITLF
jgi:hypothetical protein